MPFMLVPRPARTGTGRNFGCIPPPRGLACRGPENRGRENHAHITLKPRYSHRGTTLPLENDAIGAIRSYARVTVCRWTRPRPELVRHRLAVRGVNGLPVLGGPDDFPVITTRAARDS